MVWVLIADLWEASLRVDCAVYLWASAHVRQNCIEAANDVVRIRGWRALLRHRLWHHYLLGVEEHLLLLDLLSHRLLHLQSHGVYRLLCLKLLLRKDRHHLGLHLHLLLRLGLLRTTKKVKEVLMRGNRRRLSILALLLLLCRFIIGYGIDMAGVEESVACRFAGGKLSGPTSLLNSLYPFKRLVQVVIHQKAHCHNLLVVNLPDHTDKFGLQLSQSPMQVVQSLALLCRLHLVNDLVGEVYIAFH